MASVFLTFDNSDGRAPAEYASYSEITIGRRLYRSGESEYYINKVPCRLKDVTEFFLGTGVGTKAYSIVEQGQVERIVSARPEERRMLLEEAAGISKFKMHRDSALRKIEATKQNLARLADIIAELEHQKNSLSRQAKKAERFKIFADELKDLELSLASHQYRTWSEELNNLKDILSKLSENEASKGALVSQEETAIDSIRIELTESERRLNSLQEKVYELQNRQRLNEAEIKYKTDQIESLSQRCSSDEQEIIELKAKKESLSKELERVNTSAVNADVELAVIEESVEKIKATALELQTTIDNVSAEIEGLRKGLLSCISELSSAKARSEQLNQKDTDITSRMARNQTEIDSIDKKIAEIEAEMAGAKGVLGEMQGTKEGLEIEISSLASDTEKVKQELLHNEAELNGLNQMLSVKKSRLTSLEELTANFEGYQEGVRAVLKRKQELAEAANGIFGTVSEMLETEPAYETAVSAALGDKLQYVVVKSHQEGVEAIDYLKTQTAGRSTFVPIEVREAGASENVVNGQGVIGPLVNYVRFADDYRRIGSYLLKDIVLVEDLRTALDVWKENGHKNTLVTLDGEVVDAHGAISGGSTSGVSRQFLANKREIVELINEVGRLKQEVQSRTERLGDLRSRVQVNEARITQLKATVHTKDVEFVHKERDVTGMVQQLDNWRRDRDRITVETAVMAEERETAARERAELTEKITVFETSQKDTESKINELQSNLDGTRDELNKISEDLTAKKMQLAASQEQSANLARELKRLTDSIAEIDAEVTAKVSDISDSNTEIEAAKAALETAKNEINTLVNEISVATEEQTQSKLAYDKASEDLRARELALRELRKTFEEIKKEVYEKRLDETRSSERIFYLEREIQERYHLDLAAKSDSFELKKDSEEEAIEAAVERVTKKVADLKERIEKIGAVNTDAIGEYQGVLERYDFLTKQSADLTTSLDTLHKAIIRINRTSKERFVETFNAVNERFKALFPRLFKGGGKAELILIDQENVLESGIEIVAQPPGKKLQSVGLLSGGEKALVATTFIFSIFLIKPSPFCLLDEVDAPLDDANIDRFNQLVREMSKFSQFIMITHNRRTMELADTLYGVTMEEPGASKIVSVRLSQAKEMVKEEKAA
jgi:chromosome segregation protein